MILLSAYDITTECKRGRLPSMKLTLVTPQLTFIGYLLAISEQSHSGNNLTTFFTCVDNLRRKTFTNLWMNVLGVL